MSLPAHKLAHFRPETNGRTQERRFVGVDEGLFPDEVGLQITRRSALELKLDQAHAESHLECFGIMTHLMRPHNPCALHELPNKVQRRDEELHRILAEEVAHIPGRVAGVSVHAEDDEHPDAGDPGAVGLEPAGVGEGVAVEALGFAGAVEEDVGYAHYDVVDEAWICELVSGEGEGG